jgi:hypothetical protein
VEENATFQELKQFETPIGEHLSISEAEAQ